MHGANRASLCDLSVLVNGNHVFPDRVVHKIVHPVISLHQQHLPPIVHRNQSRIVAVPERPEQLDRSVFLEQKIVAHYYAVIVDRERVAGNAGFCCGVVFRVSCRRAILRMDPARQKNY